MSYAYTLELTVEEYQTLLWMAARGYDGDLVKYGEYAESEDGKTVTLKYPEHKAWEVKQAVEGDEHAFMTCAGRDLAEKGWQFVDSFV